MDATRKDELAAVTKQFEQKQTELKKLTQSAHKKVVGLLDKGEPMELLSDISDNSRVYQNDFRSSSQRIRFKMQLTIAKQFTIVGLVTIIGAYLFIKWYKRTPEKQDPNKTISTQLQRN